MSDYLIHFGVKGMKWGVRKQRPVRSFRGNAHRALAGVYGLNARFYGKRNKTLASMNKAARTQQLKKAEQFDREKQSRSGNNDRKKQMAKRIAIGSAIVGGTILAGYGAYKVSKLPSVRNAAAKRTLKRYGYDTFYAPGNSRMISYNKPSKKEARRQNLYGEATSLGYEKGGMYTHSPVRYTTNRLDAELNYRRGFANAPADVLLEYNKRKYKHG